MNSLLKLPTLHDPKFTSLRQFTLEGVLDEGGFAKVYAAQEITTGLRVALKVINLKTLGQKNFVNIEHEVAIHSTLESRYIVKMFGYFVEGDCLYMVLELATRGNLRIYLSRRTLNDYETRRVIRQVALGLQYLHKKKIILRDLKPENILLTDTLDIKICDFGWAVRSENNSYARECGGTLTYLSPESLRRERQTEKLDIWCLGVFAYELLHGNEPYKYKSEEEMLRAFKSQPIRYSPCLGPDDVDFLAKMLQQDPAKRPEIWAVVSHPFFIPLFDLSYRDPPDVDLAAPVQTQVDQHLESPSVQQNDPAAVPGPPRVSFQENIDFQASHPKNKRKTVILPNLAIEKLPQDFRMRPTFKSELKALFGQNSVQNQSTYILMDKMRPEDTRLFQKPPNMLQQSLCLINRVQHFDIEPKIGEAPKDEPPKWSEKSIRVVKQVAQAGQALPQKPKTVIQLSPFMHRASEAAIFGLAERAKDLLPDALNSQSERMTVSPRNAPFANKTSSVLNTLTPKVRMFERVPKKQSLQFAESGFSKPLFEK